MTNTDLKPNLEAILNDINRFININKDRSLYANHFEALRDQIFNKLKENELFSYLFSGYQLGGSYGDNLKVTKPNEFDLVFHITFPEHKLITVEKDDRIHGNIHINLTDVLFKIRNEKQHQKKIPILKKWLDDNDYLVVTKIQSYFESCFHKVLKSMNNEAIINEERVTLKYTKEGPAHTVHVKGSGNFAYSVDFVPGILMSESQSIMTTNVGQWEAIPKPLDNFHMGQTSFRSSFYRQEQKLLGNKQNLKNTLRIMKKFRDAHLNMSKMKSYFIKTLFLWKAAEKEGTKYWRNSLTTIIIDMFDAFEESLKQKRLPFFWDHRFNMYEKFSNKLFCEMLGTVQGARKTLYLASTTLTPQLQSRVYRIFLVVNERLQLAANETEPENDEPAPEIKNNSYCAIL